MKGTLMEKDSLIDIESNSRVRIIPVKIGSNKNKKKGLGYDRITDIESNIDLSIVSVQKSLEDKKGFISPMVPFLPILKEKGLRKYLFNQKYILSGFRLKSNKRTFKCRWEIRENSLLLTSFFNQGEERLDNNFLTNFEMETLGKKEDTDKVKVKATWFTGIIVTSHGCSNSDQEKNGVAYYIAEGNCIKKEVIHLKTFYKALSLKDYIENDIDLSKVIK